MSIIFNQLLKPQKTNTLLLLFLALVAIINLLQAYLTGLHPDEAYYWVYSKFLDWGYFDHPPFVALFIKAGDSLFKNPLGLRLFTVISHVAAIYILWLIVKQYVANLQLFIITISSILLFHVYAFITTPDAPLFFFSVLFLYVYQRYLKEDKLKWVIALGIICAALLMSKYHGILLIFFVLISNLKLFTRQTFYITIIVAILLFIPHLYWQYLNGYPSFYYHLIDRSATPYRFNYTSQYFLDQLLMMGPLVGWLLFYFGFKTKTNEDAFLRALKFVLYGVLVFFFLSTFKGRVQAQWPLIEFIALFILAYIYAGNHLNTFLKYKWLFAANIFLILLARLIITGCIPALNKIKFVASFQNFEPWAKQIDEIAKDSPVLFTDGFQQVSYYNYYTQSLNGVAYNSIHYRKTQYDLWPLAHQIQNKKVLWIKSGAGQTPDENSFETAKGTFNYRWINHLRYYEKVNIEPVDFPKKWKSNELKTIAFKITNPYNDEINFSNLNQKWTCNFNYGYLKDGSVDNIYPIASQISDFKLASGESKIIHIPIKAPENTGDYKLFISIQTQPFAGNRNSKMMNIKIK